MRGKPTSAAARLRVGAGLVGALIAGMALAALPSTQPADAATTLTIPDDYCQTGPSLNVPEAPAHETLDPASIPDNWPNSCVPYAGVTYIPFGFSYVGWTVVPAFTDLYSDTPLPSAFDLSRASASWTVAGGTMAPDQYAQPLAYVYGAGVPTLADTNGPAAAPYHYSVEVYASPPVGAVTPVDDASVPSSAQSGCTYAPLPGDRTQWYRIDFLDTVTTFSEVIDGTLWQFAVPLNASSQPTYARYDFVPDGTVVEPEWICQASGAQSLAAAPSLARGKPNGNFIDFYPALASVSGTRTAQTVPTPILGTSLPHATVLAPYSAQVPLADPGDFTSDEAPTYSLVSSSDASLTVAADGTIGFTPGSTDPVTLTVRASATRGAETESAEQTYTIAVDPLTTTVALGGPGILVDGRAATVPFTVGGAGGTAGTVALLVDGTPTGTASIAAGETSGTIDWTPSGTGTRVLTGTFTPDDPDWDASTSPATSVTVDSVAEALAAVTLTASTATPMRGETITLTATGRDADGGGLGDVTALLTYTSSMPTDTIDGNAVTFHHASPHTITGTLGAVSGSVTVEVSGQLAETGSDPMPPLMIGGGLLGLGAIALAVAARRRRQRA